MSGPTRPPKGANLVTDKKFIIKMDEIHVVRTGVLDWPPFEGTPVPPSLHLPRIMRYYCGDRSRSSSSTNDLSASFVPHWNLSAETGSISTSGS